MAESKPEGTLGTFSGVFTPSILTILGIILFLRLGYVVGSAGLFQALIIICAANLISVLTSFSLAAVSTNMKIRGGGDYYLISRTLGVSFGGAIGLVLFLAQSVSIAFYCIGFGESVVAILGGGSGLMVQAVAGIALVFLFALAWIGADLATKFQYGVMAFLVLALASFYIGGIAHWDSALLAANWAAPDKGPGFWILFALFFPAVTGFTQGVSMSGDLKDPGKSLPAGTFAAVILSIAVYVSVAVVFAGTNSLSTLAIDYGAMGKTSAAGFLIDAGVIAATLSSAMASFLGAPRILQSLASDRIFPFLIFFAKGEGKSDNPRRAVVLSFGIAAVTILLGELDLIAGVVSMFFLISYGLLNYATYYEASAESPSFRPRFRWYNRRISLAGAGLCIFVMLAIDLKTGIAAAAVLFAIFQYLKHTAGPARWADSSRAVHLKAVRDNLLAAQKIPAHPREWRPVILAIGGERIGELVRFSDLIQGNSGMTTAVKMIRGRGLLGMRQRETAEDELAVMIRESGADAFPLGLAAEEIGPALEVLLQGFGIGPVRANTVVVSWQEFLDQDDADPLVFPHLRTVLRSQCHLLFVDVKSGGQGGEDGSLCIDVWWRDDDTSRLLLLLAYLITRHPGWENAGIRLLAQEPAEDADAFRMKLTRMLDEIRIPAEPVMVTATDAEGLVLVSKAADMVFLPVGLRAGTPALWEDIPAGDAVARLKTVVLGTAAEKVDLDAEPDQGPQGELAELLDGISRAENRVARARKASHDASRAASELMASLERPDLYDPKVRQGLKAALEARGKADEAEKKSLKEKAKLEQLSRDAREKGVILETEKP